MNGSPSTSGARRTAKTEGRFVTYDAPDISPGHVVPGDARRRQRAAHREGRGPHRLRPRLPRGDLRHLRHGHQRRAPRPAPGHHRLPAPHAQLQGRRHASPSSPGARPPSPCSRTSSWTAAPSTASSPPAGSSPCPRAARPTATPSPCPRRTPTWPWTPPPASAAGPAWPPARTPPPCCSPRPRSRTSASCPRASPSATSACSSMVAQMDAEGFGSCTNHFECEAACPKEISVEWIARLYRDYMRATLTRPADTDEAKAASDSGGAGDRRWLVLIAAVFAASRALYAWAGVRFNDWPLGVYWQYLDPFLLKRKLGREPAPPPRAAAALQPLPGDRPRHRARARGVRGDVPPRRPRRVRGRRSS